MEVTSGFKRTEVGVIPDDWGVSTVGGEFAVQLGKMLDVEKNVGMLKPFVGNKAVQWGRVDIRDLGQVRLSQADVLRYRLRRGDLLVCEGGEVGRAAIWQEPISECYYQKALHRLRPTRGYNVRLMLRVLQRASAIGLLKSYVTQTSIAHLPKDKFETVPIPVPSAPLEQEQIAVALDKVDTLIESLEQLLAKKRLIRQGAMQQLLTGKRRLPGFKGGWLTSRLGDLLTIAHGKGQCAVEDPNGKFPILASGGRIGWANRFLHDQPSVLIGRKGTIDRPQFMASPFWTVDTLFYSIVHEPNVAKFLYYWFLLVDWRNYNEASGVPSLNAKTIESVEIAAPHHTEQAAIADVLSGVDGELDALEAKLTKALLIKQGMVQNLLTGKIRLVERR